MITDVVMLVNCAYSKAGVSLFPTENFLRIFLQNNLSCATVPTAVLPLVLKLINSSIHESGLRFKRNRISGSLLGM